MLDDQASDGVCRMTATAWVLEPLPELHVHRRRLGVSTPRGKALRRQRAPYVLQPLPQNVLQSRSTSGVRVAPDAVSISARSGRAYRLSQSAVEVDVTTVEMMCDDSAGAGPEVTAAHVYAVAVVRALGRHPRLNRPTLGRKRVDLLVDTHGSSTAVPSVMRGADELTAATIKSRIDASIAAGSTATGDPSPAPSFAFTHGGALGLLDNSRVSGPGDVATLDVGASRRQPRALPDAGGGEVIAVRSVARLTLTYDSGIDTREAAAFLATVRDFLEDRCWLTAQLES